MLTEEREMRAGDDVSRRGIVRILLKESHQLPGFLVRQRREQDRLHDTEHGGGATNAQAERGHDHAGEAGAAAKLPERVATILNALLDPTDAVHLVDVLPRQGRVAELAPRGHVRVVRRQALAEIALGEQVQMGVDFQPSVVIEPPALQREQEPRDARAERGPHVSPAPRRGGGRSDP